MHFSINTTQMRGNGQLCFRLSVKGRAWIHKMEVRKERPRVSKGF